MDFVDERFEIKDYEISDFIIVIEFNLVIKIKIRGSETKFRKDTQSG